MSLQDELLIEAVAQRVQRALAFMWAGATVRVEPCRGELTRHRCATQLTLSTPVANGERYSTAHAFEIGLYRNEDAFFDYLMTRLPVDHARQIAQYAVAASQTRTFR